MQVAENNDTHLNTKLKLKGFRWSIQCRFLHILNVK